MLKSTEQFLYTYKGYLEELGYHFKSKDEIDPEKIFDCFISTIKRTKTYEDARQAIIMFKYIMKKMDRFIKYLYKYPDVYDSYEYGSPELLSLVDEEENMGDYWLMNGLFDKWDVIHVIVPGQDWVTMQNDHGKFSLYGDDDSKYFLKCAKLNDRKVVICNSDGEKVCVAELDRNNNLVLNNNYSGYDIENDDGVVYFSKEDNEEKHLAGMFWDVIEEKEDYVLVLFELYDKEADLELLMLLAASAMILYHNMVSSNSGKMLLLSSMIAGFGHGYR